MSHSTPLDGALGSPMASAYLRTMRLCNRDVRLCLVSTSLVGVTRFGFHTVLLNLYLLRLGFGPEFVGLYIGLGILTCAVFCLPAGALGMRWGSRRILIIGVIAMAIGYVLIPVTEVVPMSWRGGWLLVTAIPANFGVALYHVGSIPFLMSATGPAERNHAFSAQQGLTAFAGFAGSMVAGALPGVFASLLGLPVSDPAPYRYPLLIAVLLLIPSGLAILSTRGGRVERTPEQVATSGPVPLGLMSVMAGFVILRYAGEAPVSSFFNIYFEDALGTPTTLIGGLAGVCQLVAVPTALAAPLAVARWGKLRTIVAGSMVAVLCIVPLALVPNWIVAGLSIMGIGMAFWMTSVPIRIHCQEIVSPGWRAAMSGVLMMGSGLGGSVMSLGGGYIITSLGYRTMYSIGAGLVASSALLFWAYFRVPRGQTTT